MSNSLQKSNLDFRAMGTDVSVEIIVVQSVSQVEVQKVQEKIKEIFAENEKIFSRFQKDSELSKINNSVGKEIAVSEKMLDVLQLCLKFYKISGGYFDPRIIENLEKIGYDKDFKTNDLNNLVGREIKLETLKTDLQEDLILNSEHKTVLVKKRVDTTGIAKGYTVDEVARYLRSQHLENFVVDAGGDMFASGADEEGQVWKIGVEGTDDNRIMLLLDNAGIATSGISRKRWRIGEKKVHHLINPKDPDNFSYDIKTVTVIDKETVEADGRAKVLVLMGRENGLKFADENDIKALFLDYKGNVYLSKRMRENIVD